MAKEYELDLDQVMLLTLENIALRKEMARREYEASLAECALRRDVWLREFERQKSVKIRGKKWEVNFEREVLVFTDEEPVPDEGVSGGQS